MGNERGGPQGAGSGLGGRRRGANSRHEDGLRKEDYSKEIAPENVTSRRRLMVKSVFSVGWQRT